jgi:FHS family L-fucose permease-like MFS transporter
LRLLSEARLQSGASWLVGIFTSVGWSNTFSLALEGTAIYKIQFSSRLVMAILGGAILPQFLVPLIAYDAFYGALGYRIGCVDGSANRKHRPTGSRSISRSMASHHLLGCW